MSLMSLLEEFSSIDKIDIENTFLRLDDVKSNVKFKITISDFIKLINSKPKRKKCNCHLYKQQVCDDCQGITGKEKDKKIYGKRKIHTRRRRSN